MGMSCALDAAQTRQVLRLERKDDPHQQSLASQQQQLW